MTILTGLRVATPVSSVSTPVADRVEEDRLGRAHRQVGLLECALEPHDEPAALRQPARDLDGALHELRLGHAGARLVVVASPCSGRQYPSAYGCSTRVETVSPFTRTGQWRRRTARSRAPTSKTTIILPFDVCRNDGPGVVSARMIVGLALSAGR